jgi:hypothetical protein
VTGSIVPSPWTVCHIARVISTNPADEDEHGNYPIQDQPPVLRRAMSITQFGRRGSSREVISTDYLLRTETEVHLVVADPETYHPEDLVLVDPQLDATGNYVPNSGIAYWVDGVPNDERVGPWPFLLSVFGGTVKLRRVT